MHILLAVLAVVAGVCLWLWRNRASARDAVETADDIRAALRRFGYHRKANVSPLDDLEDARLAAAGILAAFANMDGPLSREQISAIAEECRRAFAIGAEEAEQIGAYGRWLIQQSANMDEAVRRLARNLISSLSSEERNQLLGMVERIASIDGGELSDSQRYALEGLARQLA